jgi:hypothetical protein
MDRNPDNESKPKENDREEKKEPKIIIKNSNPRANENLTDKQEAAAASQGAGSEITDGEAG